jgi:hypothetical protein
MWNESPKIISVDPKTKVEKYQTKAPECCYVVPILYEGIFDSNMIEIQLNDLKENGSWASHGFMNPEGIVIFHKAGGYYFKKTITNDEGKNE